MKITKIIKSAKLNDSILKRMAALEISQNKVSEDLGLTPQNFNSFINGGRVMPYEHLMSVLAYLRLGVGDVGAKKASFTAREINKEVRRKINERGMKVKDAACLTGINASTLSSFLKGSRSISNRNIEKLMEVFDICVLPLEGIAV